MGWSGAYWYQAGLETHTSIVLQTCSQDGPLGFSSWRCTRRTVEKTWLLYVLFTWGKSSLPSAHSVCTIVIWANQSFYICHWTWLLLLDTASVAGNEYSRFLVPSFHGNHRRVFNPAGIFSVYHGADVMQHRWKRCTFALSREQPLALEITAHKRKVHGNECYVQCTKSYAPLCRKWICDT